MADILIRGMEMPTSCGRCRFAGVCGVHPVDEWPDLESIITNDVIGVDGERDKGCPLVPLPPHGDLIDRDNLEFHRAYFWHPDPEMIAGGHFGGANAVVPSLAIKEAPVIVPASEEVTNG